MNLKSKHQAFEGFPCISKSLQISKLNIIPTQITHSCSCSTGQMRWHPRA